MNLPQVKVNEFFGPTLQGEGPYIGRSCYFLRVHGCPVQCPGCDTHYTWDGSEQAQVFDYIETYRNLGKDSWRNGVVVSGGEPLLYAMNEDHLKMLEFFKSRFSWMSLETSGYSTRDLGGNALGDYLSKFESIVISPKITPCLHGNLEYAELTKLIPKMAEVSFSRISLKFVVRDDADLVAVNNFMKNFQLNIKRSKVFIMPYGIHADDVLETMKEIAQPVIEAGYTLTPRLHTLLWGHKRGV